MSPKTESFLKKSISLGEAIGLSIGVIGFLIGFYINVQVRLHDLETARNNDSQDRIEMKQDLKEIKTGMEEVRLELKDKADRQDSQQKPNTP